jgi:hypothetical protein
MVRLTRSQRTTLSDALRELANLAVGGLIIGQLVSDRSLSIELLVAGLVVWFLLVGLALLAAGGER